MAAIITSTGIHVLSFSLIEIDKKMCKDHSYIRMLTAFCLGYQLCWLTYKDTICNKYIINSSRMQIINQLLPGSTTIAEQGSPVLSIGRGDIILI